MDLAENYLKYCVNYILESNLDEIKLFNCFLSKGLLDKLNKCVNEKFTRISYTEAVELYNKKNKLTSNNIGKILFTHKYFIFIGLLNHLPVTLNLLCLSLLIF